MRKEREKEKHKAGETKNEGETNLAIVANKIRRGRFKERQGDTP
jgi:hypothetical protein